MSVDQMNKGPALGIRHLQALLIFLVINVQLIARLNTSVAVVAMTHAESTNPNFDEYDWDNKEISYILSSFFWGYAITSFPGGYLCRRFGAKVTLFVSTLGSSIFALITPSSIPTGGWQVFCGIRVVQGLFQGLMFPSVHDHLAKWSPVEERNRLGATSQMGQECGVLLAMAVSGLIASSSWGWPGISYVSAAIGLVWCLLWVIFASNCPSESRWISNEEKLYIETSLNHQEGGGTKRIPVPWKAIFTSLPFWALLVAFSSQSWGFSTLQAEIPLYMNSVLGMDINSNTLFSSLPYLAMLILSIVFWVISEIILQKKLLSLTALRRIFNSIAYWIPAAGLIGIGFLGEGQRTFAIIFMTIVVGTNSGSTIGSFLNAIDLSPNHAAMIMGIVNTVSNAIPILTPLFVGIVVVNEHERSEWQIVFIISAVVFFLGNLFYIIFGTAELQPWDAENFLLQDSVETPIDNNKNKNNVTN